ncbi:Formin-like protein [Arachis hypogaea]|nr:Formin-like protein [Arachis hypogaea]
MKVPRVESKLRVFSFKIEFNTQASDLRNNINIVNDAAEEIKNSVKLRRIMQTILSLGNALNQGTAKGKIKHMYLILNISIIHLYNQVYRFTLKG